MGIDWDLRQSGPLDADHTVLLLPGALCSAGFFAEVMAEPALAEFRLVAATLPGHAGAAPPDDYSVEGYARITGELAAKVGADVVVGFSNGASVALEMVSSGRFSGPAVLLGISLSAKDESSFFLALVRLSSILGRLPAAALARAAGMLLTRTPLPVERQDQLRQDLRRNVAKHTAPALQEYVRWLHRQQEPAERLCRAGVPTWIVHTQKGGDGGLTDHERTVLKVCPHTVLVTVPGAAFFLPNEEPGRIAGVVAEAAGQA